MLYPAPGAWYLAMLVPAASSGIAVAILEHQPVYFKGSRLGPSSWPRYPSSYLPVYTIIDAFFTSLVISCSYAFASLPLWGCCLHLHWGWAPYIHCFWVFMFAAGLSVGGFAIGYVYGRFKYLGMKF